MLLGNFAHSLGPKYLMECLPCVTVLNLGREKSGCLRFHLLLCSLNILLNMEEGHSLCFTLYMSVYISCRRLFNSVGRSALLSSCS